MRKGMTGKKVKFPNFKEAKTMAVSAGVLYEVRGEVARKMIQELDNPTAEQIEKRHAIKNQIKQFANLINLKAK